MQLHTFVIFIFILKGGGVQIAGEERDLAKEDFEVEKLLVNELQGKSRLLL